MCRSSPCRKRLSPHEYGRESVDDAGESSMKEVDRLAWDKWFDSWLETTEKQIGEDGSGLKV